MLTVFGVQVVPLDVHQHRPGDRRADAALGPCIDTIIPFFGGDRRQQAVDDLRDRLAGFVLV